MPESTAALAQLDVSLGANVAEGHTGIVNAKLGQGPPALALLARPRRPTGIEFHNTRSIGSAADHIAIGSGLPAPTAAAAG